MFNSSPEGHKLLKIIIHFIKSYSLESQTFIFMCMYYIIWIMYSRSGAAHKYYQHIDFCDTLIQGVCKNQINLCQNKEKHHQSYSSDGIHEQLLVATLWSTFFKCITNWEFIWQVVRCQHIDIVKVNS